MPLTLLNKVFAQLEDFFPKQLQPWLLQQEEKESFKT